MNPKLILVLALVLSAGLCGCSTSSRDLHKWQAKAAQVTVGMTREQVKAILPPWQPPDLSNTLGTPEVTANGKSMCYSVSEYTQVCLLYDHIGGEYSNSNRLTLPVCVLPVRGQRRSNFTP